MDNKKPDDFSPQESLRLISSMIETTRNSVKDSSHYFLLWGWAVMIACAIQYYLTVFAGSDKNYYGWYIIPVALVFHVYFIVRDRKREKVKTYINEAGAHLWTAIGLSFFATSFLFGKTGWEHSSPIYMMLYGIGTYVSGSLIKFRPLIIGGLLCFPLIVLSSFAGDNMQIVLLAVAILVSYIIPGHLLRAKFKNQQEHV